MSNVNDAQLQQIQRQIEHMQDEIAQTDVAINEIRRKKLEAERTLQRRQQDDLRVFENHQQQEFQKEMDEFDEQIRRVEEKKKNFDRDIRQLRSSQEREQERLEYLREQELNEQKK